MERTRRAATRHPVETLRQGRCTHPSTQSNQIRTDKSQPSAERRNDSPSARTRRATTRELPETFLQGHWTQASMRKAETATYKRQSNARRREDLPRAPQAHTPLPRDAGDPSRSTPIGHLQYGLQKLEEEPAKC